MPAVLTTASKLTCPHGGSVQLTGGRDALTVDGKPVLAKADVSGMQISGCSTVTDPNTGTLQCMTVASVIAGESTGLTAGGMAVLTTSALGLTSGNAGGPVQWKVDDAGQKTLEAP